MVKKGKLNAKEKEKKIKKSKQKPTVKEAILTYQINLKEKSLDDALFEIRVLQDDNLRKKTLNDGLEAEQKHLIKNLLTSRKGIMDEKLQKQFVGREAVVATLQKNWDLVKNCETEITNVKSNIAEVEKNIEDEKICFEYWNEYKERGQLAAANKIQLLKQDLEDREVTFKAMSGEMTKNLKKAKETIHVVTMETLAQQKSIAIKKAVSKMERFTRQEIVDNMWLHRELEKCRQESEDLLLKLEALESENLILLSQLYQCKTEDLNLTKKIFLDKMNSADELSLSNLMQIDLNKLSFNVN